MADKVYTIENLMRVMQRLRDPETGCPWDLEQDFNSIVASTLEECYELAHAIELEDYHHVAEELGDVLFQVVFYTQLGAEQGLFDFATVVNTLVEKLLRRHPHVFGGGEIEGIVDDELSVQEVGASWEAIKRTERASRLQNGTLADVPVTLPALPRAQKLQKRAAQVKFDWVEIPQVLEKVQEELDELREALAADSVDRTEDELGDLLFSCVNLSRHLGFDAESALRQASRKFERRFGCMEALASVEGRRLSELTAVEMNILWDRAKLITNEPAARQA